MTFVLTKPAGMNRIKKKTGQKRQDFRMLYERKDKNEETRF